MKIICWMGSISAPPTGSGVLVRLFDTVLGWIERDRQRCVLGRLDERMLADIGVDRATARSEADKPLWRA